MNDETNFKCHALRAEADRQQKMSRELQTHSQALIERAKDSVLRAIENSQELSAGRKRLRTSRERR